MRTAQNVRLGARLILLGIPLIVIIAGLGGYFAWRNYSDARDEQRATLAVAAESAAANLDSVLDGRFAVLELVAALPTFRSGGIGAGRQALDQFDAERRGFTAGAGWIDATGTLRAASTPGARVPLALADRAYYRRARAGEPRVLQTVFGRVSGRPVVILAVPTKSRDGAVNGVLTGSFSIGTLEELVPVPLGQNADLRVVDEAGDVILGGPSPGVPVRVDPRSPYEAMRARESGVLDASTGLTGLPDRVVGFATTREGRWIVGLSRSQSAFYGSARRSLIIELTTLTVAALLGAVGIVFAARSVSLRQRSEERRLAGAERLRMVANEFIGASNARHVGEIVCNAISGEIGSHSCSIVQESDDGLGAPRIVAHVGADAIDPGHLRLDEAATWTPRLLDDDDLARLDPQGSLSPSPGYVVAPIAATTGAPRIVLARLPGGALDELAKGAISAIVEDAAQAFDRAELLERDRRIRVHAELFAAAGAAIDTATDVQGRAEQLVEALVPAFADFATVEGPADGGRIRVVAAAHRDPNQLATLLELRSAHRLDAGAAAGIARLLEDGVPQIIASIPDQRLVNVADDAKPLLTELDPGSYIGVPLRSGDRIVAGLLLGRLRGTPSFTHEDLTFATSMAERAGVAIERARLFAQQREIALELQQSLLNEPPQSFADQVRVATRYRPAERELYVGGDWYDAIELPEGRIGLAVGDVVGHGLGAAAAMGKLASALRAIAVSETDPVEVVRRVEMFAERTEGARLATLTYAVLDPRTGKLSYTVAGHPPPLVASPDGTVRFLWDARGGPLTVSGDVRRPSAEIVLQPGATLLFYSDGLFERRGEILDDSLDRLAATVARHARLGDPQALADRVLFDLVSGRPRIDDVVILAVTLDFAGRRMQRQFPAVPGELANMRQMIRSWLVECVDLMPTRAEDVLLAFGEAVSNAVEHAYPATRGIVQIALREDPNEIELSVRDFGRWRDPPAPGPRGRGFTIMRRLLDDVTIDSDERGTTVTLTLRIPAQMEVA